MLFYREFSIGPPLHLAEPPLFRGQIFKRNKMVSHTKYNSVSRSRRETLHNINGKGPLPVPEFGQEPLPFGAFSSESLPPGRDPGVPKRVKKTRQNKNLEP